MPEYGWVARVLEHPDAETRRAAANAIPQLVFACRETDHIDREALREPLIRELNAGEYSNRASAAKALGYIGTTDEQSAVETLPHLTARLPDKDPSVRTAILDGIKRIVSAYPETRSAGTVERIAALLGGRTTSSALEAIEAHGAIALATIDVDVLAVVLGQDDEKRRHQAVETLLSLGACAPSDRDDILTLFRWAMYDTTATVRQAAVQAIGVAGRQWPATTPVAVEAVFDYLRHNPDTPGIAANELAMIAESVPGAPAALVERLRREDSDGTLPGATVAACCRAVAMADIESVRSNLGWLVNCASRQTDAGGGDAAHALLALADADPDAVAPYTDDIRAMLADGQMAPAHWATLATIVGTVEADSTARRQPAAWLSRRFPPEPLAFGPALARLVPTEPDIALPPVEGFLVTLQRSGGRLDALDTEEALEGVVDELVGAHPVVALPVVRTLISVLETTEYGQSAATLLGDTLDVWPYLAPIAEQPLLDQLSHGDPETLVALIEPLAQLNTAAAEDALAQLARHSSERVRVAAMTAQDRTDSAAMPTEMAVPAEPDASTVDRVATALAGHDPARTRQAVETLRRIGRTSKPLRARIVVSLLGYIAGQPESAVNTFVLETAVAMAPGVSPPVATTSAESTQPAALVLALCEADDPVVCAQALSVLGRLVETDAIAPETVSGVNEWVDAESPLIQSRAIQTLRYLAGTDACDPAAVATDLEPVLFSQHSLVPVTAWTLGELGVVAPDSVESVAPSITGLQDWEPLDRYNATETIRMLLVSDPPIESVVAESLLNQLAAGDGTASRTLVQAIGLLSGEEIAERRRVDALLSYLESNQTGPARFIIAERLRRVAETAPQQVLEGLADRETLPPLCPDAAMEILRTVEQLVSDDVSQLVVPLLDIRALFDKRSAYELAEMYDRGPVDPEQLNGVRSQARRSGARILATTGTPTFETVLEAYRSGETVLRPSPELVVTYLLRVDDAERRETAIDHICAAGPDSLCNAVAAELVKQIPAAPPQVRAQLVALFPELVPACTEPTIVDEMVTLVTDELSGEWDIQLKAVDTLAELGRTETFRTQRAAELLLDPLGDSDPAVRVDAAEALCDICLESVMDLEPIVAELTQTVRDGATDTARYGSAHALELLAVGEPSLRERVVELLVETTSTDDSLLRQRCLEALASIAEADPVVLTPHLDEIEDCLSDPTMEVQVTAVACLAATATVPTLRARSVRALSESLAANDTRVQQRAAKALADLATTNSDFGAQCLERIRAAATAADPTVRAQIATCLSYVGTKSDIPTLQELAADHDETVRTAATDGFDRLQYSHAESTTWDDAPMHRYTPANRGSRSLNGRRLQDPSIAWTFEIDDPIKAAPTALDDMVYIGAEDHTVYGLAAATGEPVWTYEREEPYSAGLGDLFGDGGASDTNRSSPVVIGTDLYIGHCRSTGAEFYKLDAETGQCYWTYTADADVFSSPAVVDDIVYIGTSNGTVVALHTATGTVKWKANIANELTASPTVVGGIIYIGSVDGTIHALDATDGTEQWIYTTGDCITATPAVSGATVYIGSYDTSVYALDAVDGSELWTVETGNPVHGSTAVSEGTVYVGSGESILALAAEDGTEQWASGTNGQIDASPAVRGETVYVASLSGTVAALDTTTGETRWRVDTVGMDLNTGGHQNPLIASPVIDGDTVFVCSTNGTAYAIRD
jgi:outer membrane protein assembly factor BamB/HEAT repeat protein